VRRDPTTQPSGTAPATARVKAVTAADIEHPVACAEVRGVTASVAIARCKLLTSA
jgi:hypothetical protein